MDQKVIYALSDMHGQLPDVPECDLCLIAGDICPFWNHDIIFQSNWLHTTFRQWLESIPARKIVGIAGNHDLIFEELPALLPKNLPWVYLEDESYDFEGISIYGTPYQKRFGNWPFMRDEEELEVLWKDMPACDVVLVHGPPYDAGDRDMFDDPGGSTTLARKLRELNIPWCICGHMHENYGIHKLGNTKVANVALVNNECDPVYNPMKIPF